MIEEDFRDHETFLPPETKNARKHVYVLDDNSDVRKSLHFSLAAVNILGWPFSCAQDLLDQADSLVPAPLLLDVKMPKIDGLQALTLLREQGINWPIIMMSAHGDIRTAVKSIKLGAVDFLEKPFKFENLEYLLEAAFDQLASAPNVGLSKQDAQALLDRLSPREKEVIDLLAMGDANKDVADKLALSPRTIEIHRAHALQKLGTKSLPQVISILFASNGQAI
jgi:two-component system response regulator FixJ